MSSNLKLPEKKFSTTHHNFEAILDKIADLIENCLKIVLQESNRNDKQTRKWGYKNVGMTSLPQKQRPLGYTGDHFSILNGRQVQEQIVERYHEDHEDHYVCYRWEWHQVLEVPDLADQDQRYQGKCTGCLDRQWWIWPVDVHNLGRKSWLIGKQVNYLMMLESDVLFSPLKKEYSK